MTLAEATEIHQAYLELHRLAPDDDELYADLVKARAALEVAWLEAQAAGGVG